jgi:type III secretion protein T
VELGDIAIEHWLLAMVLAAPRLMLAFTILPIIGRTLVSGLVRTGIVVSFTVFVAPSVVFALDEVDLSRVQLVGIVLKEAFIGGMIGFSIGAVFWGVQAAGFFIDNQRGAAIAGSADPLSGTESSPLGNTFLVAYTAYLFISGGFLALLGTIYSSYAIWPVLEFYPSLPPEIVTFALGLGDHIMYLTVVLSGPVIIIMFLGEFGLALISRFAPQLNVFILAMPVKSGLAMFVLVLYIPFLFRYLQDTFDRGEFGVMPQLIRLIQ